MIGEGPVLWYLNRATGLSLLVLLTVSTVLGVLAMGGQPGQRIPQFVTQQVHRNLALLSVVALVVHVASAVLDTFVDISWWQAVVPFGASYEPLWLGLGALSLDLVAVVVVTSLVRTRMTHRRWRAVHLLAWLAWVLAVVHTIGIGTDIEQRATWAVVPTVVCVLAVMAALGLRLGHALSDRHVVRSDS